MKFLSQLFCFILVLAMSGLLTACQTYEEGPVFSLKSKRARIVNKWKPYLIARNDLDETKEFSQFQLDFEDSGDFYWLSQKLDADSVEIRGSWELTSANRQIKLSYMVPKDSVTLKEQLLYMDILRLKENEMWLDYFTDGDYYSLRLSPR
ncbi:MAG: hypothetical protein D6730_18060 [Bacteroidetes bacterium]|nr:MAG: hypothetical protein D6730_18060 [Bacteroidota bacterium]